MKDIYALIIWSIGIIYLSLMPVSNDQITFFKHEDKMAHVLIYAIQCLLLLSCLKTNQKFRMWIAIIIAVLFGISLEILQGTLNTGRHFDYFDIIANIIGALLGSAIFLLIAKNIHNG
jgi:VanZ family protein